MIKFKLKKKNSKGINEQTIPFQHKKKNNNFFFAFF